MSNLPALSNVRVPQVIAERGVDPQQWNTLKSAIYPGASDQMMALVLDYCRSRNLDPLKKPVHIVKTWNNELRREVETIWEGIASHRTTAARTGEYAGQDRPVYGPTLNMALGGVSVTFPEWCEVTVYRIVRGARCPFTANVRWLETYASKKGGAPNSMWQKRAFSQLAKCAEAAALRMAFPEEIGGAPSAEEMAGQEFSVLPLPASSVVSEAIEKARSDGLEAVAEWAQTLDDAGKTVLRAAWSEIKEAAKTVYAVDVTAEDVVGEKGLVDSYRDDDFEAIASAICDGESEALINDMIDDYEEKHNDKTGADNLRARLKNRTYGE